MKRGLRAIAAGVATFVIPIGLGVVALVLALSARGTATSTTRVTANAAKDATVPCAQASDPVHNLDCVVDSKLASRAAVGSSRQAGNDKRFNLLYSVVCEVLSRFPSPALTPYRDRLKCTVELAAFPSTATSTTTRVLVVPSASPSPVPGQPVRPPARPPSAVRTTPPATGSSSASAPPPLVHIGSLICIGGCP